LTDVPYDVDTVQYPDGTFANLNRTIANESSPDTLSVAYLAIETRVEDVSFVLHSLSNTTLAHSLVPNLPPSGLSTTHTAMFGHSLGGATAFSVLGADDRVLGGLNVNGTLFGINGPTLANGTSKPFMLMGHEGHTRENPNDDPIMSLGSNVAVDHRVEARCYRRWYQPL
jgi:hypothetical protein